MPREHRKRGKKKKDGHQKMEIEPEPEHHVQQVNESNPQWMETNDEPNLDAPFGYVDPDVKGYFRTVDSQIQDWQANEPGQDKANEEGKTNEDKRMFLVAALSESSGKELQLATDPDCSVILERMLHSMDDMIIRVFTDRLCGSYTQLAQHRFGSHVCQTLFEVAATTVSREAQGYVTESSDSNSNTGVLRTMTELVLGICEELLQSLPQLVLDPFGAHVILSLLILLAPEVRPADFLNARSSLVRSKKSASYKSRQGSMRSIITQGAELNSRLVAPPSFETVAGQFVDALRKNTDGNEIRALAANKVANPVLQVIIDIEAEQNNSDSPGSIIDSALMGTISTLAQGREPEHSDYIETLLRDPTASHLFETLVRRAPESAFKALWKLYFQTKLTKLSSHPVANFVVSKAIMRLDSSLFPAAIHEIESTAGKLIKVGRTGALKALVDRAASINTYEDAVNQLICQAVYVKDDDIQLLVPCLLALKSVKVYKSMSTVVDSSIDNTTDVNENSDSAEPTIQGAVLLQSMLRLSDPHNLSVVQSILTQTLDELLKMSRHPVSSRVLDAFLDSPSVTLRDKRKFLMGFVGQYHTLVDDRIGSRVGDRCWACADPFLKERIARSIIPHEGALSASYYGKYFARNLHLTMLKRDPTAWRDMQKNRKVAGSSASGSKATFSNFNPTHSSPNDDSTHLKKRKRPTTEENEIDALFSTNLHVRKASGPEKGVSETEETVAPGLPNKNVDDPQLNDILGAIKKVSKKDSKRRSKQ